MNIEGQGHFLTLAQDHLHMKIKTFFSQKPLNHFNQFWYVMQAFMKKMNIQSHYAGHMTKMAAMPIYGKTLLKSTFRELVGQFR